MNDAMPPFAGLPSALVSDLLGAAGELAGGLDTPLAGVLAAREGLRQGLRDRQMIRTIGNGTGTTVAGVAMGSAKAEFPGAALAVTGAFLAGGLGAGNPEPAHRAVARVDASGAASGGLMPALEGMLAVELAATTQAGLVLVEESVPGLFAAIIRGLPIAAASRDSVLAKEYLARLKPAIVGCRVLFDPAGKKLWAGMPQDGPLPEGLGLNSTANGMSGMALMTLLLKPGEYTAPQPGAWPELARLGESPLKDESFVTLRDAIATSAAATQVLYYRPHPWTPAFRIELSATAAGDAGMTGTVLATIGAETAAAGTNRPYALARADAFARGIGDALSTLAMSLTTTLIQRHDGDLGDLIPLFAASAPYSGDSHA